MAHRANPEPSERFAALAMVVTLHAAVLLLVLAAKGPSHVEASKAGTLTAVSLKIEQPAKAKPAPRKLPSTVPAKPTFAEEFSLAELEAAGQAAQAAGCPTLELIRNAIISNPTAMASVHNAPPETRSVADAVVIWNAGWVEAAGSMDAPLGPARAAVQQAAASIDGGCLDEPLAGPRLIPIAAGTGTIFVVFGSGNWSWREVTLNFNAQAGAGEQGNQLLPSLRLEWPLGGRKPGEDLPS